MNRMWRVTDCPQLHKWNFLEIKDLKRLHWELFLGDELATWWWSGSLSKHLWENFWHINPGGSGGIVDPGWDNPDWKDRRAYKFKYCISINDGISGSVSVIPKLEAYCIFDIFQAFYIHTDQKKKSFQLHKYLTWCCLQWTACFVKTKQNKWPFTDWFCGKELHISAWKLLRWQTHQLNNNWETISNSSFSHLIWWDTLQNFWWYNKV